ncbi:MAG: hypothetical protein EBS79_09610 [Gammaproteobacteria bacterium]|nr:hypothetical protein [Gammaproteobacteria bacterium]
MASKIDLDDYRQRVFDALRAEGFPIDQWQSDLEAQIAADPLGRLRPFTVLSEPKFGKIRKLRPGFTETGGKEEDQRQSPMLKVRHQRKAPLQNPWRRSRIRKINGSRTSESDCQRHHTWERNRRKAAS